MRCAGCRNEGEQSVVHQADCPYGPADDSERPSVPAKLLCGNCDEPFVVGSSPVDYLDFGCWMMEQEDPATIIEFVEKREALLQYYKEGSEAGLRAQQTIERERVELDELRQALTELVRWYGATQALKSVPLAVQSELDNAYERARRLSGAQAIEQSVLGEFAFDEPWLDEMRSIVKSKDERHSTQQWHAPFTDAQVAALRAHQADPSRHSYTCAMHTHAALSITNEHMACALCDYRQAWVHAIAGVEESQDPTFASTPTASDSEQPAQQLDAQPASGDDQTPDYACDIYTYTAYGPGRHQERSGRCESAEQLQTQVLAVLQDNASEVVLHHVRACRYCQQELPSSQGG